MGTDLEWKPVVENEQGKTKETEREGRESANREIRVYRRAELVGERETGREETGRRVTERDTKDEEGSDDGDEG